MKIYQIARCPFAHRARVVLNEKRLEYSIAYFESKHRPSELVDVSPDARSPTIFDDEYQSWVWDSSVVAEYLEERYPAVPLLPSDPALRARVRLLMREVDSKLGPIAGPLSEEFVHKPPEARDLSNADALLSRLHRALEAWERRAQTQSFFSSESLTLADVWLYTQLFSVSGLVGWDRVLPEGLPHLRGWRDRLAARPSTVY
ncbi:MAG TPA: glutathione S-transferase family protein [Polyangiaceae bacterium]|nr:glutathione S-transferase family protein [Polyangiaceae bacterium]